jgi:hypothetical protein
MYSLQLIVLAAALLGFAALVLVFLRRASRARRELAVNIHDRALALDQRCDVLQAAIDTLAQGQRIDHLFDLIAWGEAEGRLAPETARRLRRQAAALRAESLAETTEDRPAV